MTWGTVTIGRLVLRETTTLTGGYASGRRTLSLAGEESTPPLTMAQLRQRQEDILGLADRFVPVTFTDKTDHNGYYVVDNVSAALDNAQGETAKVSWTITLARLGPDNAVDLESRIVNVVRQNSFALTGERWHAPAASAYAYFTGSTRPSGSVARVGDEGVVTVYRGVPAAVSPRWGAALADYGRARARVTVDGLERSADEVSIPASAAWRIGNSLVNVSGGASASLLMDFYDGTAWRTKSWNVSVTASAASPVLTWDAITIVRNDYESVTVRLVKSAAPGRALLDLTLRRGARFVEGYAQTDVSSTMSVYLASAETGAASAGYVTATASDAFGHRYVAGSAKTFATNTNGGLSASAVTGFDFFIGSVIGGASAAAGDTAAQLRDQYIATMAETTMGAKR